MAVKRAAPENADAKEADAKEAGPAQPINFGKRLAHTDKVVRDRGFKTLKKWLHKHPELERLDYMKVWRGLYYGFWMSDKRPVQQELAVNMALLLGDVPREKQMLWLEVCWEEMQDGWEKLDIHRMSKYMLLVRIIMAEVFKTLRLQGWPKEQLVEVSTILTRRVPLESKGRTNVVSTGLLFQLLRLFWEELEPQMLQTPTMPESAVFALLERFFLVAEQSYLESLVKAVHDNIILKAPASYLEGVKARVLESAAKPKLMERNRAALYKTADALDNLMFKASADLEMPDRFGQKALPKPLPMPPKSNRPKRKLEAKKRRKKRAHEQRVAKGDVTAAEKVPE